MNGKCLNDRKSIKAQRVIKVNGDTWCFPCHSIDDLLFSHKHVDFKIT